MVSLSLITIVAAVALSIELVRRIPRARAAHKAAAERLDGYTAALNLSSELHQQSLAAATRGDAHEAAKLKGQAERIGRAIADKINQERNSYA